MKKILRLAAVIFMVSFQAMGLGHCEERETAKSLSYRQKEFQGQWLYLSDKERKASEELNSEVNSYNQRPSLIALQRMEGLKIKLMENLQDQIKNDRDYIAFLELKLSGLLADKFTPIRFEDTVSSNSSIKEIKEELPVRTDDESKTVVDNTPVDSSDEVDFIY